MSELLKKFLEFIFFETGKWTVSRYQQEGRLVCLYMRDPVISEIKEGDILDYLTAMRNLGYKHNSLVLRTQMLRRIFRWAYERGYPVISPKSIPKMRLLATMPRIATAEDIEKILAVIPENKKIVYPRNHAIIRMLRDTGARCGEICSLNIDDVDIKNMKAIIRTEKSRSPQPFREIYWTKDTNDWLKKWITARRTMREVEEALFLGSTNVNYGKRLTNASIGIILRKYSKLAGIEVLNAHSFRHKFGHDFGNQGANNSIISSLLGHSSLQSSYPYTQLRNPEREQAYNRYVRKKDAR